MKEGKWLKVLTPKKLLIRLLAQIKSENNSYKLKNDKYYILYVSIMKSLKKFTAT